MAQERVADPIRYLLGPRGLQGTVVTLFLPMSKLRSGALWKGELRWDPTHLHPFAIRTSIYRFSWEKVLT